MLALLTLLGAVAACDAPPRGEEPVPPAARDKADPPALSKQQADALSERCGRSSRDEFRRGWKEGAVVETGDGKTTAEFAHHYNVKLRSCFYLLTVTHHAAGNGRHGVPGTTVRKLLFDVGERELYGEYLGPETYAPSSGLPDACRVVSFYCASAPEWDVLVEPYMGE